MRRPAHERCTPFDPMTEGGQTLTCPGRYIDDLDLRVDTQRKLDTRPDVEVEIWQQVDFIQQHQIGLGEHVRILQRLVLAFGDRQYDYLMRLTEVDSRRADEIADILDEEKAALVQWQVIERVADHVCVEMTAPASVYLDCRSTCYADATGIVRGLLVAFDHADRKAVLQISDCPHQQRRLAGARAGDKVKREDTGRLQPVPIRAGEGSIFGEDVALQMIMPSSATAHRAHHSTSSSKTRSSSPAVILT